MTWTKKAERGSDCMIRLIVWLARSIGRSCCLLLLYPIVLYFLLTDPTARNASKEFLSIANGRPARLREVFRHLYCFATTLLDRVYMANNEFERFAVTIENQHLVNQLLGQGKGCVILGSHLGSFDFMMLATRSMDPRPLNIMMRVDPRAKLRRIAGIDDAAIQIIPLGAPNSLLVAYDKLVEGGLVATLADRNQGHSSLPVEFFGRHVQMPVSPYVLAARSGAPLLACFGLYEGGNRYRIKFIEIEQTPNAKSRGSALQPFAAQYARMLEEQARLYPLNWFNFYPYWDQEVEAK